MNDCVCNSEEIILKKNITFHVFCQKNKREQVGLPSTNMCLGTVLCAYCVILLLLLCRGFVKKYPAILTLPVSWSFQDPREILLCCVCVSAFVDGISVACLVLITVILPF